MTMGKIGRRHDDNEGTTSGTPSSPIRKCPDNPQAWADGHQTHTHPHLQNHLESSSAGAKESKKAYRHRLGDGAYPQLLYHRHHCRSRCRCRYPSCCRCHWTRTMEAGDNPSECPPTVVASAGGTTAGSPPPVVSSGGAETYSRFPSTPVQSCIRLRHPAHCHQARADKTMQTRTALPEHDDARNC